MGILNQLVEMLLYVTFIYNGLQGGNKIQFQD